MDPRLSKHGRNFALSVRDQLNNGGTGRRSEDAANDAIRRNDRVIRSDSVGLPLVDGDGLQITAGVAADHAGHHGLSDTRLVYSQEGSQPRSFSQRLVLLLDLHA